MTNEYKSDHIHFNYQEDQGWIGLSCEMCHRIIFSGEVAIIDHLIQQATRPVEFILPAAKHKELIKAVLLGYAITLHKHS